jgi:hypothetical protein
MFAQALTIWRPTKISPAAAESFAAKHNVHTGPQRVGNRRLSRNASRSRRRCQVVGHRDVRRTALQVGQFTYGSGAVEEDTQKQSRVTVMAS